MLDLRFIRENADLVRENCRARRIDVDVDRLVELAQTRTSLTTELQDITGTFVFGSLVLLFATAILSQLWFSRLP